MKHVEFRTAAEELQAWANRLPDTVKSHIPQCLAPLEEGKCLQDATPEQSAELILRQISGEIENIMGAFDATLRTIGMEPRFATFFRSLELTDDGLKKLHWLLSEFAVDSGPSD